MKNPYYPYSIDNRHQLEIDKVGATEQSIRQYMDKMNKALKNVK